MDTLLTLSASETLPLDYIDRTTVKGVIYNNAGELALFGGLLLGGGVEVGEKLDDALVRECMEEGGISVLHPIPLGIVVQYRDVLRKKYIVHGFVARLDSIQLPTSTQAEEQSKFIAWMLPEKAIFTLQQSITELEYLGPTAFQGDEYQSRLYNAKTSLCFIERAIMFSGRSLSS